MVVNWMGAGITETRRSAAWRPIVARRRSDRFASSIDEPADGSAAVAEAVDDGATRAAVTDVRRVPTGDVPTGGDLAPGILERRETDRRRDQSAEARLWAAEQRDAVADGRDVAALARDQAAAARDVAAALAGAASATAAESRVWAAQDRLLAARDREHAARERRRALVDREMLVVALQRERDLRTEALAHQHRAERLARTLQRSLSPPSLPSVWGLDVAVHYEPSAPEDVGGDFYDLFPLAAGRSGFFLGDVCGKGPDAAAITSLARYTMRTAAMLSEEPAAILADLNAALLMRNDGMLQTCTAVYGQVDVTREGAAVTLAAAGHPPPLIVRAGGAVEIARAHGTILGAVEDPMFVTCRVSLAPGDAIVLYSDGIHDAKLAGVRVDEQRLSELLADCVHASAQNLVDGLTRALSDVERPLRDDIAIMALRRTSPA